MVTSPPETRRVYTLGEFSEKLNASTTKELVYPEEVPEGKQDNQFQSWLLSVQTCLKSISQTPRIPARSSIGAGSPTLMEKQQLCKPLKRYLESDVSTKAGNFRRIFDLKQSINWEFYKPMLQPNIQYLIIFCLPSGNIHSAHYAKHVSFVELQVQTSCFAAPLQGCLPFRPE